MELSELTKLRVCNRGLSTVFGTVLALTLIVAMASALFVALYRYNGDIKQAISTEDERSQEKILIANITLSDEDYITSVTVKNLGSVTSQIRAYYVDSEHICDPSNPALNQNGAYIESQRSEVLNVKPVLFNPTSRITIATSRGIKAIELESNFINGTSSTYTPSNTNYGPLRLNFTLFYYRGTDSSGIPIGPWQPGANISSTVDYCEWNITVTNIDPRNITLDRYSTLTLVKNVGGGQYPWYITYPGKFIQSGNTTSIVYTWARPPPYTSAQGFSGFSSDTAKVFLSFYGKFSDGTTYGQTIPFESVLRL